MPTIIMPKGKKGHATPHICVPVMNPRQKIPSHQDQQARYRLQCSVLDLFHSEIQRPIFLSIGPDAKLDVLKMFDLNKPFDLHLNPPSSENLALCRKNQNGKAPMITTDFYLTNVEPSEWILPTLPINNETDSANAAAAASNSIPDILVDQLQTG